DRLTQPLHALDVPPTVQAVLAARIDRLAPEDKRLLQTASVVGNDVPLSVLQEIAELPDEALRRGLDRLRAAEFVYEAKLFPEIEYTFTHALTHEVAYGGLLHERRRALHARIVEAFERIYADRLADHAERLADHALRGEVWDKAVRYLRDAVDRQAARSAHHEARRPLEAAFRAPASARHRHRAWRARHAHRGPLSSGPGPFRRRRVRASRHNVSANDRVWDLRRRGVRDLPIRPLTRSTALFRGLAPRLAGARA